MLFTNDNAALAARLLKLFPVEIVKKEYQLKGKADSVYEIIARNHSFDDIMEDSLRLFGHAKQHCYLYSHDIANLTNHPSDFLSRKVKYSNKLTSTRDRLEVEYLRELSYHIGVVKTNTLERHELKYYWPVKVIMRPRVLEVRMVIMEQKLRLGSGILDERRSVDEVDIHKEIQESIAGANMSGHLDLNKGIKSLWKADLIDARDIAHKSASSIDRSTMDGSLTFKNTYPTRYSQMISNPLRKGVYANLSTQKWPDKFSCDPLGGFVGVAQFQELSDAIENLISEILVRNA